MTRPITFDAEYHGQVSVMGGRASLSAKATINRHEFGLGKGVLVRFAASSLVTIEIDLVAVQQPMEAREPVASLTFWW